MKEHQQYRRDYCIYVCIGLFVFSHPTHLLDGPMWTLAAWCAVPAKAHCEVRTWHCSLHTLLPLLAWRTHPAISWHSNRVQAEKQENPQCDQTPKSECMKKWRNLILLRTDIQMFSNTDMTKAPWCIKITHILASKCLNPKQLVSSINLALNQSLSTAIIHKCFVPSFSFYPIF